MSPRNLCGDGTQVAGEEARGFSIPLPNSCSSQLRVSCPQLFLSGVPFSMKTIYPGQSFNTQPGPLSEVLVCGLVSKACLDVRSPGATHQTPLCHEDSAGSLFASGCGISDVTSPLGTHASGKISKQSCMGLLGHLKDSENGWHTLWQSDHSMEPFSRENLFIYSISLCSKMNLVWRLI